MTGYRLLCCLVLLFLLPAFLSSKVECQATGPDPTSSDVLCLCPKLPVLDSEATLPSPVARGADMPLIGDRGGQIQSVSQGVGWSHRSLQDGRKHFRDPDARDHQFSASLS